MSAPPSPTPYKIKLWRPTPAQRMLSREAKRFTVVDAGRRSGKSEWEISERIVKKAIEGLPVAWMAPSYELLNPMQEQILAILAPLISKSDCKDRFFRLVTGGSIKFFSLQNENVGRGRKFAHIGIDEAAHYRHLERAWTLAIRPTLSDLKGSADFVSTPNGRNFFYNLFQRGQSTDPKWRNWWSIQLPTSCNPFIPASEIEEARLTLPAWAFAQEYLASFDAAPGSMFKREWFANSYVNEVPVDAERYIGLDKALGNDYTAATLMAKTKDGLFWIEDILHGKWTVNERDKAIYEFVRRHAVKYPSLRVLVEQEGGSGGKESAQSTIKLLAEFIVKPQTMSGKGTKAVRAAPFSSQVEAGNVKIKIAPWNETLVSELCDFTTDDSHQHDDLVDSTAMAFNQLAHHEKKKIKVYGD